MNREKILKTKEVLIAHIFPSISDVIFISIFIYLSLIDGSGLLVDCDTGYHIRAGEVISKNISVPKHDIFSFIEPPIPWTAHEWLSEVIMAKINGLFGLTGIVLFFGIIIALIYSLLFKFIRKEGTNILLSIIICIMVIASSKIHWLARPHIFSLLIITIWHHLLDLFQYRNKNYIFILPLIMLVWVNLHGGFILGLIMIIVYIAGNLLTLFLSHSGERNGLRKKIGILCFIFIGCFITACLNPYGVNILIFPFKLMKNTFIMDHVNEFISPDFHRPMPFKYIMFLIIALPAIVSIQWDFIEILLILLFTNMALFSARFIPLFCIVVSPVLSRRIREPFHNGIRSFIETLKVRSEKIEKIDMLSRGHIWAIITVSLIILFAIEGRIEFQFDRNMKPVDAVEFLKKEQIKGNMFNNDEFGDYIIYAAWPQYRVFFDGRSDMYGSERMKEYFKVARVEPGWDEVLNKYNINFIVFNANSSLSLFLMERDDWKLIYADKIANIFVKNTPDNRYLIEKYPDVKLVFNKQDKDVSK